MPASKTAVFQEEGYKVWGATLTKCDDGHYHLLYSRWKEEFGHGAWVSHSEIAYAVGETPFGPFEPKGAVISGRGDGYWDGSSIHNPTVIKVKGKYYMYYMGTYGTDPCKVIDHEDPEWWVYRNNQRVGVAWADHPSGPWHRLDQPVIDVTKDSYDHLMTSNPSAALMPDGRILMVYKAVGNGDMPKGGPVICGVAIAEDPLGPFEKADKPIMQNPENDWSVEDPFIWYGDGKYYALVKDFQGYFTKSDVHSTALFESDNGMDWFPGDNPFAFDIHFTWSDGEKEDLAWLERPQLYIENGQPKVLLCAAAVDNEKQDSFNVQIPLKIFENKGTTL